MNTLAIVEYLTANGPSFGPDILRAFGRSSTSGQRFFRIAIDDGVVVLEIIRAGKRDRMQYRLATEAEHAPFEHARNARRVHLMNGRVPRTVTPRARAATASPAPVPRQFFVLPPVHVPQYAPGEFKPHDPFNLAARIGETA